MEQYSPKAAGTQALILQSAEHLFTRFGYTKVTMYEISAESSLGKASLYYYYATKEDLFHAVVEMKRSVFRERVNQIVNSSDPAAACLTQYVLVRFDYFKNLQELNILDFKKSTDSAHVLKAMFLRHAMEELQWLTRIFESGRRANEFQIKSSKKTAETFLHILQGLRLRFMRDSEILRPTPAAFVQLRREMVQTTELILAGIRNQSAGRSNRIRRQLSESSH